jgi:hypothetical protein
MVRFIPPGNWSLNLSKAAVSSAITGHPQPYLMLPKNIFIRIINSPHKARWFESWNIGRANWIVTTTRWNIPKKKYSIPVITEDIRKQIL